jgi:glycosyltransferase involved in cell wall biosynthesis
MLAEKLPPEFTGSGKQAAFLAKALIAKNVDTIGLCSNPNGESDVDMAWGFPIFRLRTSAKERVRSLEFAIKSAIWLLKNRTRYDIVHVHGYCWGGLTGLIVAKLLGKKTIYKITLPGEDDPDALYQSRFGKAKIFLLNQFDAFVSISNRVQKCVEELGIKNVRNCTIPNGVDERFYRNEVADREARKELIAKHHLDKDARIILFMGSIEHRKGVDVLARAWPWIVSRVPEGRLLMVGPFFEQTSFHRQFLSLLGEHLGKTVFLVGNVSDPEDYYRASDVFVFPSRNESFGNVLVEAMGCGTACVATRIEGITEDIIVHGINGLVVPQEDSEALAESILMLLERQELRSQLGRNAADTVREKFGIAKIAHKYKELYDHLLGRNHETIKLTEYHTPHLTVN